MTTLVDMPATSERVARHSTVATNERIRAKMRGRVKHYEDASLEEISQRIEALQREWDIERMLETNTAALGLAGLALGVLVDRRWLLLPTLASGFLLQHALQGWCPPLPVMRRLGVRTATEIHEEITALRILRGDFEGIDSAGEAVDQATLS